MSTVLTRHEAPILQQAVWSGRHASGCEVYAVHTPGLRRHYGLFAARYGSIASVFRDPASGERVQVPDGVAHFLEHRLFEQPDGVDVTDRFAALGASTNAFTWYTQTAYLFSTVDNPVECLDLLIDFVQEPHFVADKVENEKGIIAQEIGMYEDDPYHRGYRALMEALYQSHPVGIDIAGTVETIAGITPEVLQRCWSSFYHPANMVLVVGGPLEPQQVAERLDLDLAGRDYAASSRVEVESPDEPDAPGAPVVENRFPIARPRLMIGVKDRPLGAQGTDLIRRNLATAIGLGAVLGRAGEAYDRWYRDGLIDDSFGAHYTGDAAFAFTQIAGDTDRPEELADAVWDEIARVRRDGIAE
jgi:predicted Zn-dependent peptidase